MKFHALVIFLDSGHTFTFYHIELVIDNESMLRFKYTSASDGREKVASFPKANIAGWSVASER